MLKHHLLLIYRNFLRNKTTFFINLIGLSTGLACALLIYLWVNDELNVDRFHEKDSRLFQVMQNIPNPNGIKTIEHTPTPLARALIAEMPEVEYAVSVIPASWFRSGQGTFSVGDMRLRASAQFADKDFFNVFSHKLIQGDKDHALSDKYGVLLSDELAMKLFDSTENLIGKTVEWDRGRYSGLYHVAGIFEKPPRNSTMQFDVLFSFDLFFEKNVSLLNLEHWGNSNPSTYVVLRAGSNVEAFNNKIRDFRRSKYKALVGVEHLEHVGTLFLQRYSDRYLYSHFKNGVQAGGRIAYVKLFSLIALFLLAIACVNFMNLSTARASRRMKEIGIKKSVGADRKVLIVQFLSESVLMALLSLIVAIFLVVLLLPEFNLITGKQLRLDFSFNMALASLAITLATGLFSGSYPALYLSRFKPAIVLKGKLNPSSGEAWARKGLVVFQFAISIILIVSVVVVYKQIELIQTKNLGYDKDNIISFKREGALDMTLETFLQEVKRMPGVVNATSVGHNLTGDHGGTAGLEWEGKDPDERIQFGNLEVDYDWFETLDIEMAAGRTFSREFGSDSAKIIFNEAAIGAMGLEDPIGKTVNLWGEDKQIIGVTKSFHFESLYEQVKPCFMQCYPNGRNVLVKIKSGMEREVLERIGNFYREYNQGLPFEYKFLDQDYQALYAAEQRVSTLSKYFAGIAILISCLGLFGLAAFTAERRLKEIGIRKVLGSSEFAIVKILTGDFTRLVVISIAIAVPVSYLIAHRWLESFAYSIDLTWWYFAGVGIVTLLIAWFTVGMQTVKAALVNPAKILRSE